jgi:integrase
MATLSDLQIRALLKANKPIAGKSDGGGLTFTLSGAGVASWVLRYRLAGKAKELTLGRYPDVSLSKARELAAVKRCEVQQVIDVAAVKQQKLAETKQKGTVSDLAELWLNNTIRRKHKHPQVTERVFKRDILPAIGNKDTMTITTGEVTRLLAKINASGRPTIANDALRHLKSMFSYGEMLGLVERNPAEKIRNHHAGGQEKSRIRALSQKELATLFNAMEHAGASFGRDNELAVKLLLALACRKMELFAAKWSEFDFNSKTWHIPAERTKTAEARELQLAEPVIAWLEELKVRACNSEQVFPARRTSKRFAHVSPDTTWAALQSLEHGLEPFTIHDLRRTARTLMSELGVPFDVAEKILGHRLPGTAAIYDRGGSKQQQRVAMEKVAAMIAQGCKEPSGQVMIFKTVAGVFKDEH